MTTQCKHPHITPKEAVRIIFRGYIKEIGKKKNIWLPVILKFLHGTGFKKIWRIHKWRALKSAIAFVETTYCTYCDEPDTRTNRKIYFQYIKCSSIQGTNPMHIRVPIYQLREDNELWEYFNKEDIELYGNDPDWKLE